MKQSTQCLEHAALIKAAFEEGYNTCAVNVSCVSVSVNDAWNGSFAKVMYNTLHAKAKRLKEKGQ